MADFEQVVELSLEIPSRELGSARDEIEGALSDVAVSFDEGPVARSSGGGGGPPGAGGGMERRMRKWARQRTETLDDIHQVLLNIGENMGGGGGLIPGLGGEGGILGGAQSVLSGVGLLSLTRRVSLSSLLKKAPAFATLVKTSELGAEFVTGKLTAEDLIEAPIEVGDMVTFGLLDNKAVEAAIGSLTLAVGGIQLAKGLGTLLGSVGIGSLLKGTLGGSALAGFLGRASIGLLLKGIGVASGVTLAGLLGTVALSEILDMDVELFNTEPTEDDIVGPRTGTTTGWTRVPPSEVERIATANASQGPMVPEGFQSWNQTRQQAWAQQNPEQFQAFVNQNPAAAQEAAQGRGLPTDIRNDLNADVTVETAPDRREIVEDTLEAVDRELIQPLRRDLERSINRQ